jgi:hypothetical protein
MNNPTEQDPPEDASENELNDGSEKAALDQLAEAGDEEAARRR